ncbi:hypothetical protein ScPMuIL_012948 [Solemya velum]
MKSLKHSSKRPSLMTIERHQAEDQQTKYSINTSSNNDEWILLTYLTISGKGGDDLAENCLFAETGLNMLKISTFTDLI